MPASRSATPSTKPPRRSLAWLVAAALVAALGFVIAFLPASIALRYLPADVQAEQTSGTLWHGSFGSLTVRGRPYGAVEWHLHPLALATGKLAATLRWVKQDLVIDADVEARGRTLSVHALHGGGSLDSLSDLALTRGWTGNAQLAVDAFTLANNKITAATGSASVNGLKSAQFESADLGGLEVLFGPDALQSDGGAHAQVRDNGGPLQLQGLLTIAPAQGLVTFSGTLKQRGDLPAALRRRLDELAQMRGRDAQGAIPLDVEFSL